MRKPLFRRLASEEGTSLVEVLVATIIMAISFGAILGGFMSGILGSEIDRRHAIGETQIRALAEHVKGALYDDSCNAGQIETSYASGFSLQGGTFDIEIEYWDGNEFLTTCTVDGGMQRVRLTVQPENQGANPSTSETLELIKRDGGRVTP